jgi:hypothetical protein
LFTLQNAAEDNQTHRRNLEASVRSTLHVLKNNVVLGTPWFRAEHLAGSGVGRRRLPHVVALSLLEITASVTSPSVLRCRLCCVVPPSERTWRKSSEGKQLCLSDSARTENFPALTRQETGSTEPGGALYAGFRSFGRIVHPCHQADKPASSKLSGCPWRSSDTRVKR